MKASGYLPAAETMDMLDYAQASDEASSSMRLPPGYRFHPTDEELVGIYLREKVVNGREFAHIGVVDFKCEPSKLPEGTKMDTGENEIRHRHYFFSPRDRKYPTGMRTNRSTEEGYWKATGKDKEIKHADSQLIMGMKKTLVFYQGRAPKGLKTNWIMHEYRLEGEGCGVAAQKHASWVICRVFHKSGSKSPVEEENVAVNTMVTPMDLTHLDQNHQTNIQTPATSNNSGSTSDSLPVTRIRSSGGSMEFDGSKEYQDDAENVNPDSYGIDLLASYHKHRDYDVRPEAELGATQSYETQRSPQRYRNINNVRVNLSTSPSTSGLYFGQNEINRHGGFILTPAALQQHRGDSAENQGHLQGVKRESLEHGVKYEANENPGLILQAVTQPTRRTFQDMSDGSTTTSAGLISDFHAGPMGARDSDMPGHLMELPDQDPFATPIPWSSPSFLDDVWSN